MDSTSTTSRNVLDAMMLSADDFVSAFGGAAEYHPSGGKCTRARCAESAPWVKLGKRRVKLPCKTHAAEDAAASEEEERCARAAACLIDSGVQVGSRLWPWSFETYARDCGDEAGLAALATARRWTRTYLDTRSAPNLLLWGHIGCGKTGLAWSIVREICEHGTQARLVNFRKLLAAMKDCYSRRQPTTWALDCGTVPVLALDDLGSERPTEWACEELLGIVDERYERGLPTIYVSNYAPADLIRRLSHGEADVTGGTRIVSRMREGAMTHEFGGGDRRVA